MGYLTKIYWESANPSFSQNVVRYVYKLYKLEKDLEVLDPTFAESVGEGI